MKIKMIIAAATILTMAACTGENCVECNAFPERQKEPERTERCSVEFTFSIAHLQPPVENFRDVWDTEGTMTIYTESADSFRSDDGTPMSLITPLYSANEPATWMVEASTEDFRNVESKDDVAIAVKTEGVKDEWKEGITGAAKAEDAVSAGNESRTRAADESSLNEIHLYLFGSERVYRRVTAYSTVPLELDLLPGIYRIYAVANKNGLGRGTTELELEDLLFERRESAAGGSVMSCREEIVVSKELKTKDVALAHCAAKVTYTISTRLLPSLSPSIKIVAVQLCNLPDKGSVFDGGQQLPGGTFGNNPTIIPSVGAGIFLGAFYMPENRSGNVPSITSLSERSPANAPATATCLRIQVRRLSRIVTYYVYLGGNTTDDFNVLRGMHYNYNIVLRGRTPADMQVAVTVKPL